MRSFTYARYDNAPDAVQAFGADAQFLAGGTTLVDLMRLNVMRPQSIVDINPLSGTALGKIEMGAQGLKLGALAHMAEAADHKDIRAQYPVIAQALDLAASPQIRNMATLGGNVLQRTRCTYFRDVSYGNCNKRISGSGCAALDGVNRSHAILGASKNCIATYPGDFAQALIALDAEVEVAGPNGARKIPFANLHVPPGDTPQIETTLKPGELITAFNVPAGAWTKRSLYLKVRDRESYEFALASAAVALDMEGDKINDARIALGGVATLPWRACEAEALLKGKSLDDDILTQAADAAFQHASARRHNQYKVALGKRTMTRALRQAAAMEI
ncbi:MAG TPA: xanthine dehydrogenase family protein subunit M [Pseudolabrys sp.]|nr:xanthine dehydrogenase family protein subunit M [Pseudolabrys sp.]